MLDTPINLDGRSPRFSVATVRIYLGELIRGRALINERLVIRCRP